MPRRRTTLKRHAIAARNQCVMAIDRLAALGIEAEGAHPELEEGLASAVAMLNIVRQIIETFYIAAWGSEMPPGELVE